MEHMDFSESMNFIVPITRLTLGLENVDMAEVGTLI